MFPALGLGTSSQAYTVEHVPKHGLIHAGSGPIHAVSGPINAGPRPINGVPDATYDPGPGLTKSGPNSKNGGPVPIFPALDPNFVLAAAR